MTYWRLVIATGAIAFVPPVQGLAEHAVTMWSVADAQELQRRIEAAFKQAAKLGSAEERAARAQLHGHRRRRDRHRDRGHARADAPQASGIRAGIDPADLRVRLVEGRREILFDLPEPQRAKAVRRLERMGVELVLGSMVEEVEPGVVRLADGREIDSNVLVFCGGAKADPDAIGWGLAADNAGRLVVDQTSRSELYPDVYSVGDVSSFRDPEGNRTLPMLAQFAIRESQHAARQPAARGAREGAATLRSAHARRVRERGTAMGRGLDVRHEHLAASRRSS